MRRAAIRRQQACYSKKNSHRFTRFTLQADLELFVVEQDIYPKYLFLLYKASEGVWEIRSTRPTPSDNDQC